VTPVMLGRRGDLHRGRREQGRGQHSQDCLSHFFYLPCSGAGCETRTSRFLRAFALEITMTIADYYAVANHETASQIVGQNGLAVKYSAAGLTGGLPFEANNGGGLPLADPVQWTGRRAS
jgi:hypothetical protein